MLKDSAYARRLFTAFGFESRQTNSPMAAKPPTDENRPNVGTAFDYLARFWLKRQHPDAETYPWNAVNGAVMLEQRAASDPRYAGLAQAARESLASATAEYVDYIRTGNPTDGLMCAALDLAELDVVCRAWVTVGIGAERRIGDVADLHNLWKVMERGDLGCLHAPIRLNPDFGIASTLVRGADADIVADDVLVDIKTGRKPTFTLKHFRQLAGYAALQRLAERPDFREVGVYLARYGKLLTVGADCIYGSPGFSKFLAKFQLHAEDMFGPWERPGGQ